MENNIHRCMFMIMVIHKKEREVRTISSQWVHYSDKLTKWYVFSNRCTLCMLQTVRSDCNQSLKKQSVVNRRFRNFSRHVRCSKTSSISYLI